MAINVKSFMHHVGIYLFDGKISVAQASGLSAILGKWEAETPDADDRWLAYMLGTAHHETGRTMQPVRETFSSSDAKAIAILNKSFAAGKLGWVKEAYWNPDKEGKSWLGRGLVQLTHRGNYVKMSKMIGEDLVSDPARAMNIDIALKIMFVGMREGAFTTKKLMDYFDGPKEDWRRARRIINGLERADLVASYARQYYAAISYTV